MKAPHFTQQDSMLEDNAYKLTTTKRYIWKKEKVAVLHIGYYYADFTGGDILLVFQIKEDGSYRGNSVIKTWQFTDGRRNYEVDLLEMSAASYNQVEGLIINTYHQGSMMPDTTRINWFNLNQRML